MFSDRRKFWLGFRFAMVPWMFFCGILAGLSYAWLPALARPSLLEIICFGAIGLLLFPIMTVPLVALQATNQSSDRKWSPPRHDENPFWLGNPLRGLHLIAFQLPVMGLGMMTSSIWSEHEVLILGALQVLGGSSVYAGMLLSMKVCEHKMCNRAERSDYSQSSRTNYTLRGQE